MKSELTTELETESDFETNESETAADLETESESDLETESESDLETESESDLETESELETETQTEMQMSGTTALPADQQPAQISYQLNTIIFILLFVWAERKLKYIFKNFSARKYKE